MSIRINQYSGHFVGLAQVAAFFGVGMKTVRAWLNAGAPFYRIGQVWHSNYNELWEWLKAYYGKGACGMVAGRKGSGK